MNPTTTLALALLVLAPLYARAVTLSIPTYNPDGGTTIVKITKNGQEQYQWVQGVHVTLPAGSPCRITGGWGKYQWDWSGNWYDWNVVSGGGDSLYISDTEQRKTRAYEVGIKAVCRGEIRSVAPTLTVRPYGGTHLYERWTVSDKVMDTGVSIVRSVQIADVPELRLSPNECSELSVPMSGDLNYLTVVPSDIQVRNPLSSLRVTASSDSLVIHACAGGRGGRGMSSFVVRASLE
ncbi:hypothetical protein EGO53_28560 (plasmid) [Serratia liquefaciens]|uniref:Adhesin n=1 Tax=Serratia liquefaciens TaxID=614 RepID=A0A515D5Q3_SERLI|nr:hypothetical protein EGO53_28560 [Serratia liquefaciens]